MAEWLDMMLNKGVISLFKVIEKVNHRIEELKAKETRLDNIDCEQVTSITKLEEMIDKESNVKN
ncbi:MAG: hypothetical protein PV340_00035 [Wolbachia sp.]|nr:hypothetical protein [Wolbachia sp.]MDD9336321.1 hypothetical protein [Wolbachia sp.]